MLLTLIDSVVFDLTLLNLTLPKYLDMSNLDPLLFNQPNLLILAPIDLTLLMLSFLDPTVFSSPLY